MKLTDLLEGIIQKPDLLGKVPKVALQFMSWIENQGFEVRLVGGCVRDLLLGVNPKDWDMATNATPTQMLTWAKPLPYHLKVPGKDGKRFANIIETGLQHGTLTFVLPGKLHIEITTLRADVETDGRHAKVEFVQKFEQDAERRDLTYNALSMDRHGRIFDYFGGVEDLQQKRTRFVGSPEKRIQEDYLRILRFFRFQGRYGGEPDPQQMAAIKANIDGLKKISGERIWAELSKIYTGPNAQDMVHRMVSVGLFEVLDVRADPAIIDMSTTTMGYPKTFALTRDPVTLYMRTVTAPLHDGIMKVAEKSNARFHWSSPEFELARIMASGNNPQGEDLLWIKKAMVGAIPKFKMSKPQALELAAYMSNADLYAKIKTWNVPNFPVMGQDLVNAGVPPGPDMGKTLQALKLKWIDSDFLMSKEELLATVGASSSQAKHNASDRDS